jgi:hypothetical protein
VPEQMVFPNATLFDASQQFQRGLSHFTINSPIFGSSFAGVLYPALLLTLRPSEGVRNVLVAAYEQSELSPSTAQSYLLASSDTAVPLQDRKLDVAVDAGLYSFIRVPLFAFRQGRLNINIDGIRDGTILHLYIDDANPVPVASSQSLEHVELGNINEPVELPARGELLRNGRKAGDYLYLGIFKDGVEGRTSTRRLLQAAKDQMVVDLTAQFTSCDSPCKNGGVCAVPLPSSPASVLGRCVCAEKWQGVTCEDVASGAPNTITTQSYVLVLVIVLVIVLVYVYVFVFVFVLVRCFLSFDSVACLLTFAVLSCKKGSEASHLFLYATALNYYNMLS